MGTGKRAEEEAGATGDFPRRWRWRGLSGGESRMEGLRIWGAEDATVRWLKHSLQD
jgi:hypothetical protein